MAVPGDSWCFSLLDTTEPQGQCTQWTFLCHLISYTGIFIFGSFWKSLCEKCPVQCNIDLPKAALDKLAVNEAWFQFQRCFGSLDPSVLQCCDFCRDGRSLHVQISINIHKYSEHSWSTKASLSARYCAWIRKSCIRLLWLCEAFMYWNEWTHEAAKYPAGLVRGSSRTDYCFMFSDHAAKPAGNLDIGTVLIKGSGQSRRSGFRQMFVM